MADIQRRIPPPVYQTHDWSCWAAVLESWSRIDQRFNHPLNQAQLMTTYSRSGSGGLRPSWARLIAGNLNLEWRVLRGNQLNSYLLNYLPESHIFCAFTQSSEGMHAVLIYKYFSNQFHEIAPRIHYMDPFDIRYHPVRLSTFAGRPPFLMMRKR